MYPSHASLPVEMLVVTPPTPILLGDALERLRPVYLVGNTLQIVGWMQR